MTESILMTEEDATEAFEEWCENHESDRVLKIEGFTDSADRAQKILAASYDSIAAFGIFMMY